MKINLSRDTLLKPLQHVTGVIERRQNSPVLSNLLVKIDNGTMQLTGTDLEVEMQATTPVDATGTNEITIPARKFMDICRTLPEGAQLDLQIEANKITIRSGRSRFTLATLPAQEFPQSEALNPQQEITLSQARLKKLIDQTQFAMAQQDVRYYLNGLLFEITPEYIRTVTTDGHRLAFAEITEKLAINESRQVIIPRKGVGELSKLLEDSDATVRVQLSDNHIKITLPDVIFISKLIDGKFPDYNQVIPQGHTNILTSSREALRQALSRASVLSNEKYRGMRLTLSSNNLKATIHNPEQEEAEEELEVNYSGDEFEIGFNVAYFLDVLGNIKTEEVTVKLRDSNSSCLIQGVGDESCKYVIMPMRL